MLADIEEIILTEADLVSMDKERLASLLAQKTEHLLIASRCQLSNSIVQPLRNEVQMIQTEMRKRELH